MRNLKILVINVCLRPYKPQIMFPLGLSYVVEAIKRAGYDFEILDLDRYRKTDEEIMDYLRGHKFDVVAMGCIATGYKTVKRLCQMARETQKDATIVVGNSVADSIPKLLLEKTEADVSVIGEGEISMVEVLDKLKNEGNDPTEVLNQSTMKCWQGLFEINKTGGFNGAQSDTGRVVGAAAPQPGKYAKLTLNKS